MIEGVSVVICCYNSAVRLPETLKHLAQQKIDEKINWEIIIVNNKSTDNTNQVVQNFIIANPQLDVKLLHERTPGLSYARHCGFREAQYEYVLLCDDDNWLAENYVNNAWGIMRFEKEIGVLGGVGEAVSEMPLPRWFKQNENSYAIGKLFGSGGYVKYIYGAGMVLRRSVYLLAMQKGYKSLLSDRKGKELSSGGDLELCYLFQLMGYKIYQSDKLLFKQIRRK